VKKLLIANCILALCFAGTAQAQSLRGSPASIKKQYQTAVAYGYSFVRNARSVSQYVNSRELVRVNPGRNFELHAVSYPYALPETRAFLEALAGDYRAACGEKLTVTSLLRPADRQPANSVAKSVHPAGMAIDLRVPSSRKCRAWLEQTLLSLEKRQVVEATREYRPPHFHVAVLSAPRADESPAGAGLSWAYLVRKGDTLSRIAARTGVSLSRLRAANGLRDNLIYAGQKLRIPAAELGTTVAAAQAGSGFGTITHRVNRGDTLWRIANRYGTSVDKLREANKGLDDYLQIGQVLLISKG